MVRSVARDSRMASAATRRSPRTSVRSDASIATSVPGAHRQAEVGRGQRGGVVHAVADHRDHPALGLQPADDVDLAGRQHAGDHVRRRRCPPRAPTVVRGRGVVAGEQHRAQAEVAQLRATASALVGFTVSATTSSPRAAPSQPTATTVRPVRPRRAASASVELGRQRLRPLGQQRRPADDDGVRRAVRRRRRRPARRGPRRSRTRRTCRQRAELRGGGGGDRRGRPGARWPSSTAPASRSTSCRATPVAGTTSTSVIRPVVTVPVLSSTTVSTRRVLLEHLRPLDDDAELRAAAGADQQRRRRRQAEGARAGDDQHRDGGGERELGLARRCRARTRAWRRRAR